MKKRILLVIVLSFFLKFIGFGNNLSSNPLYSHNSLLGDTLKSHSHKSNNENVKNKEFDKVVGKQFVFKLINAATKKPIVGHVKLKEHDDAKHQQYKSHESVFVPSPKNEAGKIIIECDLFGYELFKKAINYQHLATQLKGVSVGANEEVIIPIELQPLKRGTYFDFRDVQFYENSDIVKPESESKLMELVYFMQNPNSKIRLHGHVHNPSSRELILRGDSHHFFSLEHAKHRMHNTAKKLSHHRVSAIRDFLVSKGIPSDRIMTVGYGATLAIFETAQANERIEVEIAR